MSLLHKTEDIFKPAPPQKVDTRRGEMKNQYEKDMASRSNKSIIKDLVDRDMDSLDDENIKWLLQDGFVGYNNMTRTQLIRTYEEYFGGWEDHIQ